ncbi:MAG TPA: DUF488 domain-containing protein [Ktedonobacterales bacterium]
MEIYTIGVTKKTAQQFFETLQRAGIRRVLDIRLNNTSQLAGFAKQEDLAYFLRVIGGIEYQHEVMLAPTQDILDAYRKDKVEWEPFRQRFLALMRERQIERRLDKTLFATPTVLLCSEALAEHCHRSFVANYLRQHWGDVTITNL